MTEKCLVKLQKWIYFRWYLYGLECIIKQAGRRFVWVGLYHKTGWKKVNWIGQIENRIVGGWVWFGLYLQSFSQVWLIPCVSDRHSTLVGGSCGIRLHQCKSLKHSVILNCKGDIKADVNVHACSCTSTMLLPAWLPKRLIAVLIMWVNLVMYVSTILIFLNCLLAMEYPTVWHEQIIYVIEWTTVNNIAM